MLTGMTGRTGGPIRVALIDDYEIVVKGLARMFDSYGDRIELVELDAKVPVSKPVDIALYDTFAQPQGDTVAIDRVLDQDKAAKVVLYSWNLQPELIESATAKGVAGYLSKSLTAAELVEALEKVHRGDGVIVEKPEEERDEVIGGDWPGRAEGLTHREAEVIALITQGLSNQDIAARTFLSINSVKTYIRSAYRKMSVTTRSQAVLWGVSHGFRPDRVRITNPETR
jgi:DNA-binding NarL/FixJ family response regulator